MEELKAEKARNSDVVSLTSALASTMRSLAENSVIQANAAESDVEKVKILNNCMIDMVKLSSTLADKALQNQHKFIFQSELLNQLAAGLDASEIHEPESKTEEPKEEQPEEPLASD